MNHFLPSSHPITPDFSILLYLESKILLHNPNVHKATGTDEISTRKEAGDILAQTLKIIIIIM